MSGRAWSNWAIVEMVRARRRTRATALSLGLLLALVGSLLVQDIGPAVGITTDTGWTQQDNGGYPVKTSTVSCYPNCIIWPPGSTLKYYNNILYGLYQAEINNAVSGWDSTRWAFATAYLKTTKSSSGAIVVSIENTTSGTCADTPVIHNNISPDGGRNQGTIISAQILVQYHNPCTDTYNMMLHEVGHSFGLGHTTYTSQVMFYNNESFHTPQSRDVCGQNRIYYQVSC